MMDGCYHCSPTRYKLEYVHFKIVKGHLDKNIKKESKKSAKDTELFGKVKCATDCKQQWKDLTVLSDKEIKSDEIQ